MTPLPPSLTALAGNHPTSGAGAQLESLASDVAWQHRWDPWPSTWEPLSDLFPAGVPLVVVYAAARRLHYHFAHVVLRAFTAAALAAHPADPFLTQLHLAAAAALGERNAWEPLLATATRGTPKQVHVLLSAAFAARHVPDDVLAAAIDLAQGRARTGDAVAAYRVVSLLRRAGHTQAAFDACEQACLVASTAGPDLGDHLAERLLVERHLITTATQ